MKNEVKVFGATFEKNYTLMYIYRRINDCSKSIFDADQHSEVYLTVNDYGFALICKESTKVHIQKTDFSFCNII